MRFAGWTRLVPQARHLVRFAAVGVAGVSIVVAAAGLERPPAEGLVVALLLATIVVGEMVPVLLFERHMTAPLSTAAALSLCLLPILDISGDPGPEAADTLAVIALAMVVGGLLARVVRSRVAVTATAARFLGIAMAVLLYREVRWYDGMTAVQIAVDPQVWRSAAAGIMLLCTSVAIVLFQPLVEGILRAQRDQSPLVRTVVDEIRSGFGLAAALVSTGTMVAVGEPSLKALAIPLFLSPLLFTQLAVVRYGVIRRTYTETIRTLSTLTDVAGYTTPGHAERVSVLAVPMARVLGMTPREVVSVEYAALLHDLGQVALREPIPGGATVLAAPVDQRRIAKDGADIVRQTGVLDEVSVVLEAQTTPYRQVRELGEPLPMASRIIKVANAFDDLAGAAPGAAAVERALERINLGLGYEYDPKVVEALTRVLERRRTTESGR